MISRNYLYFLSSVNEDRWRPLTEDEEGTEKVELGKHKSKDTFKLLNMITYYCPKYKSFYWEKFYSKVTVWTRICQLVRNKTYGDSITEVRIL